VFITGASSGIGRALALHYGGEGATLGLVARREALLESVAAGFPGRAACYALDVRDAGAMRSAASDFIGRHGLPDIVIASAGVSHGTLTERPEDLQAFADIVAINLLGMVGTFQPFVEPMREAGRGVLAGIASVAGIRGLPGAGAYSASKAAAIAYLESLRTELAGSGVAVVSLLPGYIDTPMTDKNPYRMPFLLTADEGARRLARAIRLRKRIAVVPWQMAIVARLMRLLPAGLYNAIARNAPRKPRRS